MTIRAEIRIEGSCTVFLVLVSLALSFQRDLDTVIEAGTMLVATEQRLCGCRLPSSWERNVIMAIQRRGNYQVVLRTTNKGS